MKNSLLVIAITVFTISCNNTKMAENSSEKPTAIKCENGTTAVLKKLQLDGCNWVLVLPTDEKLEPMNINEFLSDTDNEKGESLNVRVAYYETKSASICMVGKTVAITCFEVLKE